MSKQKPEVQSSTVVTDGQGRQVNPNLVAPAGAVSIASGKMSFDTYCAIREIPVQNRAGMRVFTKTQAADLKEWDAIFRNY